MQDSNNNSLSHQKSLNSDLINLRDDFEQFRITINSRLFNSFNDTLSSNNKNGPKTFTSFPKKMYIRTKHSNLLINKNVDKNNNYNINFKIEENEHPKTPNIFNNIKKIKKIPSLNEKFMYKKALFSIKKLNKSKTQINFFSPDNSYKNFKDIFSAIKNISSISKTSNNKLTNEKFNKTNSFNLSKDKTIYYNSSLENFYIKNKINRFKANTALNQLNRKKYSLFSPQSHCVNFIRNIINLYNKNNDNKNEVNKENIKTNNNKNKKENENKDTDNFDGMNTFNQISLKNLFQKNTAKIKNDVLNDIVVDKKIKNNDIFLNPFTNSYGVLLDLMSEKVGFMKGSMDILYPKITQKMYQIRTLERKTKNDMKRSSSQENYKIQYLGFNNNNNFNNKLFNLKQKKSFQSIYTRYPVSIKKIGQNKWTSKMYSFKGQKDLKNKKISKTANI